MHRNSKFFIGGDSKTKKVSKMKVKVLKYYMNKIKKYFRFGVKYNVFLYVSIAKCANFSEQYFFKFIFKFILYL